MGKFLFTIVFLAVLGGLATVDYMFSNNSIVADQPPKIVVEEAEQPEVANSSASSVKSEANTNTARVKKRTALPILTAIKQANLTSMNTDEPTFLEQVLGDDAQIVEKNIILKNDDRIAVIAWVDSPLAKSYFRLLKDALFNSFTDELTDLRDELQQPNGLPNRNYLTFKDPGITNEQVIFIRVRQRIVELRIGDGSEPDVASLLELLSQ